MASTNVCFKMNTIPHLTYLIALFDNITQFFFPD